MASTPAPSAPSVRVVYVVGCTHSGSTLLSRILNQHSRIFSAGELQYLDRCWGPTGRPCSCGEHPVRCSVWGRVFWTLAAGDLDLAPVSRVSSERSLEWIRALTGKLSSRGKNPFPEANRQLFDAIGEATGARVVVDNSKDLWRLLPLARAFGDQLRVLHLVRRPEGHVASYMGRKGKGFARAAFGKYLRVNLLARFFFGSDPRYRKLRYEDLVGDPEACVADLQRWLELDPEDPFAGDRLDSHEINTNVETHARVAASLRPDPSRARAEASFTGWRGWTMTLLRRLCYER